MQAVKDFALMVCGMAVLCALAQMVVPSEKYEKVIKLALAAFMLCGMIFPLTGLSDIRVAVKDAYATDSRYFSGLQDKIMSQTEGLMERSVAGLIDEALQKNGIIPIKISISMDTFDDGSISIGQVEVVLSTGGEAAAAESILRDDLRIENVECVY